MVELYIKHSDNNYYKLDINDGETINYKLTVRDLNDISKVFAPFTQPFSLPATDKNKILCGFVGNEKVYHPNNSAEFDALIYVSGFIFQSGKLTFQESDYELWDQKDFKTNFAGTVSGLSEKLGDYTIQDCFDDLNDPALQFPLTSDALISGLQSATSSNLISGIEIKRAIPFISNVRTWFYNKYDYNLPGNLARNSIRNDEVGNFIKLSEVRPAISYSTIMKSMIKKFDLNVVCPVFDRTEVKDLFAWCSAENLVVPNLEAIVLKDYEPMVTLRYDEVDDSDGSPLPTTRRWETILNQTTGLWTVTRQHVTRPASWGNGFEIFLKLNGLVSKDGNVTKVKIIARRTSDGAVIDSQVIEGVDFYAVTFLDTQLDISGQLSFQFEILPQTLVDWTNISAGTLQKYDYTHGNWPLIQANHCKFSQLAYNITPSSELGGGKINLATALPKMKCVDFLSSFFKTFNISVIPTGLNDQSMFWLTPADLVAYNQQYSKRIVDYTPFTDISTVNKKQANKYNQYLFSHFASKYYESVFGDGTRFGDLTYPSTPPDKPTKFEVKTQYSIIKQASTFYHPSGVRTCLGFSKETPTVMENGSNLYKPVYDELTLFYLKNTSLGESPLNAEKLPTFNGLVWRVMEASYKNPNNGKTLAFGSNDFDTDSLYLNYYKDFIEMLLRPNTYASTFNLVLPPNEIFLNFANLKQGESNIPIGFRAQNEIIIGEQRYSLADAGIDLTTGKTKLTLLNF